MESDEEIDPVFLAAWPDCAIKDCPNKCCLRLASPYCYPHSIGIPKEALEGLYAKDEYERA